MDRGGWWATVHGVAKSQTGLSPYITQALSRVPVHIYGQGLCSYLWAEAPSQLTN